MEGCIRGGTDEIRVYPSRIVGLRINYPVEKSRRILFNKYGHSIYIPMIRKFIDIYDKVGICVRHNMAWVCLCLDTLVFT